MLLVFLGGRVRVAHVRVRGHVHVHIWVHAWTHALRSAFRSIWRKRHHWIILRQLGPNRIWHALPCSILPHHRVRAHHHGTPWIRVIHRIGRWLLLSVFVFLVAGGCVIISHGHPIVHHAAIEVRRGVHHHWSVGIVRAHPVLLVRVTVWFPHCHLIRWRHVHWVARTHLIHRWFLYHTRHRGRHRSDTVVLSVLNHTLILCWSIRLVLIWNLSVHWLFYLFRVFLARLLLPALNLRLLFFVPWLRCNFDAFVIIFLALIAGFYTILHDLFLQLLTNSLLLVLVWAALISVFTGNLFFSLRVFNFVDLPCFPGLFCFLLLFSISHSLVDYRLWFFLTLTSNHVYFRLWLFHKFL